MDETRQLRIAKLTAEVNHRRSQLTLVDYTLRKVPSAQRDKFLARKREVEEELRELEKRLHALRVEQIREELAD